MPRPRRTAQPKDVIAITHPDDARRNIPTAELEPVMADADRLPVRVAYERRNRDLDPQLVWRGKDAQDDRDLVVAAPPLFTQEKVHPKVLVDDLMRLSRKSETPIQPELDLFADFNGLHDPAARAEFYQHDQNWTNRMILGDSLQVMASLAEREGLRGKVQCIYIDPPYGIRFNSNFQWSTTSRDVRDGNAAHITREPEQVKAFRDTWSDGIHSYLSYLRDRLTAARDLLADSGSVFVQIGDENVHLIRALMDEVFGESNFIAQVAFTKTGGFASDFFTGVFDFLLHYGKNRANTKFRKLYTDKSAARSGLGNYGIAEDKNGNTRNLSAAEKENPALIPDGSRLFGLHSLTSGGGTTLNQPYVFRGIEYNLKPRDNWKASYPIGMDRLNKAGRMGGTLRRIGYKRYFDDFPFVELTNMWSDTRGEMDMRYVVQTTEKIVERCILSSTDPGDLVLDPTCGSGTTAYVAEQWGRRWITIDTSRVALALARARVMGARYPWYLLADSPEGQRKEAEIRRREITEAPTYGNLRQGFVYQRVPHITLRDIANNAEIDVIYDGFQETLEPLRESLNAALGQSWPEWEIPRDAEDDWPEEAAALHRQWWEGRIARQREIDASIAANANFEYLYDKPYEDRSKVRVAGPFTVESVSPHRVIAADDGEGRIGETGDGYRYDGEPPERDFAAMILDNLRTSGVQQSQKADKIDFTALTGWPGEYICAEGRFMEGETERRAGIFIGPEFGTVQRADLAAAAREAAEAGFHAVIACAFSYDAHASELGSIGSLPVLKARMNSDLHMAEDLKNDSKGNLFVIFGEPDIELLEAAPGTRRRGADAGENQRRGHLRPGHRPSAQRRRRRHSLLVRGHQLQRRELFRPPSLLPRRQQRPLQGPENHAESRNRRGRLGHPEPRRIPPLPQARLRPHSRKGNQPPRRRGDAGAPGVKRGDPCLSLSCSGPLPAPVGTAAKRPGYWAGTTPSAAGPSTPTGTGW